jgi:uncharacterized protein (DUF1800 family)
VFIMTDRFRIVIVACVAAVLTSGIRPLAERPQNAVPARPDDKAIIHVLNRIGFGPTPDTVARVRQVGLADYIEQQLHPDRIDDAPMAARLEPLTTLTKTTQELAADYFVPAMMERREQQRRTNQEPTASPSAADTDRKDMRTPEQIETMRGVRAPVLELSQQKVLRAAYSERQLEEVLVDFWFNHFNVFVGKGVVRMYLTEYERDAIRPHVLGKFRDLVGATAHSPAMLFYLDNWQSTAAPEARTSNDMQRRPPPVRNPSFAGQRPRLVPNRPRIRPSDDGMPMVDQRPPPRRRGLNENYARELMELHTLGVDGGYTQKDVQEVARAFTGWTISAPRQGGTFRFDPRMHDDGDKAVLGHVIKAGGGKSDGEQVLDILVKHPSTARFVATKLARRFVADDPPKALVDRAAARFTETGGDLRAVVRTILTSPEFFAPTAYRAKTKTPFEFVVSAVRTTGIDVGNALALVRALQELGMPLYGAQPPTGYADRADAWVNSGALLNRMNFAVSLTGGQLRARGSDIRRPFAEQSARDASNDLFARALARDVSESTVSTVGRATTAPQAIALILGSPEFQKR